MSQVFCCSSKFIFLHEYRNQFFRQGLSGQPFSWAGIFEKKNILFFPYEILQFYY